MALFKRGKNWWIDYYYQDKRYRQKIGTTKQGAEEALSHIRVQIAAGAFVPPEERRRLEAERKRQEEAKPKPISFEDFATKSYLSWSEVNHSPNHHRLQQSIVRIQLVPKLKAYALSEITPRILEDYIAQRRRGHYRKGSQKRPVKAGTVNRDIACLKILFRKAVEWGHLEESPARRIKTFKELPNPPRLLEPNEIAHLMEHIPEHLKALIACVVYAGLRREELFHLRWKDINYRSGELTVVSNEEHPTKNRESRRIPMNAALVEALRRHTRRLGSPYVFCNQKTGQPYDNVRKALRTAAREAGIEGGVKLHQLRHAFCSHALMRGIDPRTVQRWMGHKDLTTTMKYAHISPDHERAAIQRLRYDDTTDQQTPLAEAEKTG